MQEKKKAEVYATYFNEVLSMVQTARIDVVGHLDLMKRYAFSLFGNYSFADYENVLTQILQCVISRGIGIEINTSGWRNAVQEPYPSREVLQLYKRLGGIYITIGSDAHTAEHLATDFLRAQEILRQCGFTEIYVNCNSKLNTFIIHNDSQLAYTLSKNLSKSSSGVWYSSTRLGRLLRASANDRISSSVYRSIDSPLGM